MGTVTITNHPLIQHKLSILRDKNTGTREFRQLIAELAMLECYEATRDLPLQPKLIETPIGPCNANELAGRKMAIIPILRAGLGMVDGILNLVPSAKVGHIGMFRDPETHAPVPYYCKLPHDVEERDVLVLDPMLATGGSLAAAIDFLFKRGAMHVTAICLLAAPEGLERL
ncbi:MAG: uracil phosphoribosyltransferase, partial [Eubacteriales bacterium]|nr:uracil phosphoribosyltransferase [Eubacteriales bacterium]